MVICKTKMNCYLDRESFASVQFGIPQYFKDIANAVFCENTAAFRDDGHIEAFVFRQGFEEIAFVRKEYAEDWLYFIENYQWIPLMAVELYEKKQGSMVEWMAIAAEHRWKDKRTREIEIWDGKNKSEQEMAWEIQQYFKENTP